MSEDDKKDQGEWDWKPGGPVEFPVVQGRTRRLLVEGDIKRMNLGRAYWAVKVESVQDEDVQRVVQAYRKKLTGHLSRGTGLVITGAEGVGKSGAAALLAMEAARWGYTVRIVSHEELQELRFEDRPYDDANSLMERIRSVDFLVLDDFNEDFVEDNKFGPKQLEKLVSHRNKNRLVTVLTTRVSGSEWQSSRALKSLWGILQETTMGTVMEGVDLRKSRNEKIKQSILGKEEK